MKRPIMMVLLTIIILLIANTYVFSSSVGGNTTLGGVNGYIVIPSAEPVYSSKDSTVTTGYSAIFSGKFAHVPFIQFGFAKDFEVGLSVDIDDSADVLLNAKWRFSSGKNSSIAAGLVGQALNIAATDAFFAAQLYMATTFSSTFIDWPTKTTVLVGYTFDKTLDTNIDFGMAFETPFLKDVFNDKVTFLIDFGNVSYSADPSGGNANNRGLLNVGLRLLPVEFMKSVFVTFDLRALDLFDHTGRALSAGVSISLRP
jgi:hypothetical protein